jgi:hypothetical protein
VTNPPDAPAAPRAEGAALSRQLGDFLIELSIALHKHAMYPDGHPSLAPACVQVASRLSELLSDRPSLSLGVARTRLVIEGVATDPKNPVLRDLASRLHRHQLGAVTLRRGVPVDELQSFLRTVAAEPERTGEPLGPASKDKPPPWFHVRVHPLSYDQLRFAEGEDHVETAAISRAEQLWIGLAQAALATAEDTVDEDEAASAEPAVVAKAIGEHKRGSAYDQVIVGYLLQLAEELRSSQGRDTLALKRRLSELVGNLDRPTLGTLLAMGGDRQQRRQFLLDASHTLTVDAVLDVVQAASNEQEGQMVSHSLLRMLQKLAKHADSSTQRRRVEADVAIREQVAGLIRDWTLKDPNPDEYREALETMSASAPLFAVSLDQRFQVDPQRIVQMALESNVKGDLLDRSVRELIDGGELSWLLETLSDADAPDVTETIEEQVASPEMLASLLATDRLDVATLDLVLARVGTAAADVMMDELAEANSGHTRRILLDRLIALGPDVGPLAIARLADPRWFVQRNMLVILGSLPERPPGVNPADFLQHRDPRVRREAIRILLRDVAKRERAVCHALADEDPRTVQLGLNAALEQCPETAIPLVVSRTGSDVPADLRTLAIRVLGNSGQRTALDTLLRIVERRRGLFRSRRQAKSPEYLAALAALQQFAEHPSARRALDDAANSSDPDVVRAATSEQT